MADKRYFWMKLSRDFFKRHDIRIIEGMENGKEYVLFYMKLLCESIDHEGNLRFSEEIPYTEDMLAAITNTDKKIVYEALEVFHDLGLIEIKEDGTFYLKQIEGMIGFETEWAEKKRQYRDSKRTQEGQTKDNVLTMSEDKKDKVRQEIEKDKEKEKELYIDTTISPSQAQEVAKMYSEICFSLPGVKKLTDKRRKSIRALLKAFTEEEIREGFEKAEASDFCKGANGHGWKADFDFLINQNNMTKVLEGKYDNRSQEELSIAERWANA